MRAHAERLRDTRPRRRSRSWCGPTRRARASRRRWWAPASSPAPSTSTRRSPAPTSTARRLGAELDAHRLCRPRRRAAAASSAPSSRRISSRARSWRPRRRRSASCTGVQGIRWYEVNVTGKEAHAGPTPMARRHDALVGAAAARRGRSTASAWRTSRTPAPPSACCRTARTRATPSRAASSSPSTSAIPNEDDAGEDGCCHPRGRRRGGAGASARPSRSKEIWYSPPVAFDRACVAAVRRRGGGPRATAAWTSSAAPATMPSTWRGWRPRHDLRALRGRHQPQRDRERHAGRPRRGCNVLLHAMLDKAGAR